MTNNDYYDVWLDMLGRVSRPSFLKLILARAGVTLNLELVRYLIYLDLRGPLGVLELAELVEQNHPKVSRTLAQLAQRGLVSRGTASQDRRIKTAHITPEGKRIVEAINLGRRRLLDEAFTGWSEQDRTELARLTRRLSDAMFALIAAQDPR